MAFNTDPRDASESFLATVHFLVMINDESDM